MYTSANIRKRSCSHYKLGFTPLFKRIGELCNNILVIVLHLLFIFKEVLPRRVFQSIHQIYVYIAGRGGDKCLLQNDSIWARISRDCLCFTWVNLFRYKLGLFASQGHSIYSVLSASKYLFNLLYHYYLRSFHLIRKFSKVKTKWLESNLYRKKSFLYMWQIWKKVYTCSYLKIHTFVCILTLKKFEVFLLIRNNCNIYYCENFVIYIMPNFSKLLLSA